MINTAKFGLTGIVTKTLYDTKKYNVYLGAKAEGIKGDELELLRLDSVKPLFKPNSLWGYIKRFLRVDIKIPYITGKWVRASVSSNTITSVGKKIVADQIGGTTTTPVTAIAIGVGSPTSTALGSEITTNGGSRGAAVVTNETTSTTGDTEQWVKVFNFTGSFSITEEGLFDNNTSGGNMLASQSFTSIGVANTDSLEITHTVQVT